MTGLLPGPSLRIPAALAMLAIAVLAWSSNAWGSAHRGSGCGKRLSTASRVGLRCGLRPDTAISGGSGREVPVGSTVSFKFSSTKARSRFQCRTVGRAWTPCRSPSRYQPTSPGFHRFSVRAVGPGGLADLTPATVDFRVAAGLAGAPSGRGDAVGGAEPTEVANGTGIAEPPGAEGPTAEGEAPPAALNGTPFVVSGVWAEPLPLSAPVDPASTELIGTLMTKLEEERVAGTGPRLGADSRTPLYRVGANQPLIPVFLDTGPWGYRLAEKLAAGVPIPAGAEPVAGTDRAMAVWQQHTDTYWEFFKMQQALHGPQFARSAKVSEGCALQEGTYSYEVTAFNLNGETQVEGGRAGASVADGACIAIQWGPVHGATGYRIYRGRDGSAATYLGTVAGVQSSFLDDGLGTPISTLPPAANTATTPGEWHAAYGGMIEDASASPGYYRNLVDSNNAVQEQANWGAAATGLPLAAGLITREDVDRGSIDHALAIGLSNRSGSSIIRAGSFASPAQRSDGRSADPTSIPEGARLRLDPSLDIDSLPLSPFARMLAEAAQRYGMIVQDGSRSTVVYAEDPSPAVREGQANFYEAQLGKNVSRAVREFPWAELEVVQMQLCQRSPCISDLGW